MQESLSHVKIEKIRSNSQIQFVKELNNARITLTRSQLIFDKAAEILVT